MTLRPSSVTDAERIVATWTDDGVIVATNDESTGLLRLTLAGGEPEELTRPDPSQHEIDHLFPFALPGRRAVLYTAIVAGAATNTRIAVVDLDTKRQKILLQGGSQPEYHDGFLIYVAGDTLRAVRFDAERLEVSGDPFPVLDAVMTTPPGAGNFALSGTGALLYVPPEFAGPTAGDNRSIVWIDRHGREESVAVPPRPYTSLRLSPDEARAAVEIRDRQTDIWVLDFTRQESALRRLTFDRGQEPAWTANGTFVLFSAARNGSPTLFRRLPDGGGADERVTSGAYPQFLGEMAADGRGIGFEVMATEYLALLTPSGRSPSASQPSDSLATVTRSGVSGLYPRLSPEGRFVVYQSSQGAGFDIYVRPFPNLDAGIWQISTQGGVRPVWSKDGREIFSLGRPEPTVMAVTIDASGPTIVAGSPTKLFDQPRISSIPPGFDVSKNGRFLMVKENAPDNRTALPARMVIVQHWLDEVRPNASGDRAR